MLLRFALSALLAASWIAGGAASALAGGPALPIRLASGDCAQAAANAAAQTGGRVLSVSSRNQNGQPVCVVTILIPSDDGGRPRKEIVVVPQ